MHVLYACHLNIWEVDARGSEVQNHPWLHTNLKVSLGYTRPCLKKQNQATITELLYFLDKLV